MAKHEYEYCKSDKKCKGFYQNNRPIKLKSKKARSIGLCAECEKSANMEMGGSSLIEKEESTENMAKFLTKGGDVKEFLTRIDCELEERRKETIGKFLKDYLFNFRYKTFEKENHAGWAFAENQMNEIHPDYKMTGFTRLWLLSNDREYSDELIEACNFTIPSKSSSKGFMHVEQKKIGYSVDIPSYYPISKLIHAASGYVFNDPHFDFGLDNSLPTELLDEEIRASLRMSEEERERMKDVPLLKDYNCAGLVTDEEVEAIFGKDYLVADIGDNIANILNILSDVNNFKNPDSLHLSTENLLDRNGLRRAAENNGISESAFKDAKGKKAQIYMAQFAAIWDNFEDADEETSGYSGGSNTLIGRAYANYLSAKYNLLKDKDPEAANKILFEEKNADFLLDSETFTKVCIPYLESLDKNSHEYKVKAKLYTRATAAARRMRQLTDLIDKKWAEKYEKEGVKALCERFGRPVGIPDHALKDYHFVVGGYLVESGWLKISEADEASFAINFPVDANGKPDDSPSKWLGSALNPRATIRKNATRAEKLQDIASACAQAVDAWHIAYNKGLNRDSLYTASQLAFIDNNPSGLSSNFARGTIEPNLEHKDLPVVPVYSKNTRFLATGGSKIMAFKRGIEGSKPYASNGVLSVAERDLSNYRLARFKANKLGNEYDSDSNLGREFHESLQNKIRNHSIKDGVTQAQQDDSFVFPLINKGKGETVGLYFAKPATYARRTGLGVMRLDGVGKAVQKQIEAPLSPLLRYNDPVSGLYTDGSMVADMGGVKESLNPYQYLAQGGGVIEFEGTNECDLFKKQLSIASGNRGELSPKRLRFAATSLGEKAGHSGLILPVSSEVEAKNMLKPVENIHKGSSSKAVVSNDNPKFSPELTAPLMTNKKLFFKDSEVSIMGEMARSISSDIERKKYLQAALAGKQSEEHRKLSKGIIERSCEKSLYTQSPEALGNPFMTGGGVAKVHAKGENGITTFVTNRSDQGCIQCYGLEHFYSPVFDGAFLGYFDKNGQMEGADGMHRRNKIMYFAGENLPFERGGRNATGAEKLPLMYNGESPKKSFKAVEDRREKIAEIISNPLKMYPDMKEKEKIYQDVMNYRANSLYVSSKEGNNPHTTNVSGSKIVGKGMLGGVAVDKKNNNTALSVSRNIAMIRTSRSFAPTTEVEKFAMQARQYNEDMLKYGKVSKELEEAIVKTAKEYEVAKSKLKTDNEKNMMGYADRFIHPADNEKRWPNKEKRDSLANLLEKHGIKFNKDWEF